MFKLKAPTRAGFLDRASVTRRIDAVKLQALKRIGAFIRRDARSSIRPAAQKRSSDLTDAERVAYTASKARVRDATPDEIAVVRNGTEEVIDWKSATATERRVFFATARIRKARRPLAASRPGQAPRSRTGKLRSRIQFALDTEDVVVIGPELFDRSDVPGVLEFGGGTRVSGGKRDGERVQVAARPFMRPAMERNVAIVADQFAGRF